MTDPIQRPNAHPTPNASCSCGNGDTALTLSFSTISAQIRAGGGHLRRDAAAIAVVEAQSQHRDQSLAALACLRPDELRADLAAAFGPEADSVLEALSTFAKQAIRADIQERASEALHTLANRMWNLGNAPGLSRWADALVAGEPAAVAQLRALSRSGADVDAIRSAAWGDDAAATPAERAREVRPLLRDAARGVANEIQRFAGELDVRDLSLDSLGRVYALFPNFVVDVLASHGAPYASSFESHREASVLNDFIADDIEEGRAQAEFNHATELFVHGAIELFGNGHVANEIGSSLLLAASLGGAATNGAAHVREAAIAREARGGSDASVADAERSRRRHIEDGILGAVHPGIPVARFLFEHLVSE